MIAVDTNLLVYAHRADAPQHRAAVAALERLVTQGGPWAIPLPCATEFVSVLTRPALSIPASPASAAFDALDAWLSHPRCQLLVETAGHLRLFRALVERAALVGRDVFDARIAAICLEHDVAELWTSDRDFSRFPDLRTRDPLIPSLHEPIGVPYRAIPSARRARTTARSPAR